MELIVLGAGPAYTDRPGATGAAYLVRFEDAAVLLDFGQGSFPALAGEVEPSRLLSVLVSHLHPDHFIDLVPLRHYLRYEFEPPRRVRVDAPGDLPARLDALHDEPGFTAAALDVVSLAEGAWRIGPFAVEAALVTHTSESYAFRLSTASGHALVYSGDVSVADDLGALLRPGDTLLCEAAFGPGPVAPGAQHLDARMAAGIAARAGAGRLLLTHIQMGFDRAAAVETARTEFGGQVDLVDPGYRTTV